MTANHVVIDQLTYAQQGRVILDKVSATIQGGEIVTLIGPNGAGKSSLIKILLGLEAPTQGQVRVPNHWKIGYMPQKLRLNSYLPLRVIDFLRLAGKVSRAACQRVLEEVNAAPLLSRNMTQLSGGETQRVLLARAMLGNPHFLVLDEPVQGVDVSGQVELYGLIRRLRDQGATVLMVSHDLHLVMSATDQVICLNHHVCCSGHPEAVSQDPAYRTLFGREEAANIAVYTHHHDHEHHISGEVKGPH